MGMAGRARCPAAEQRERLAHLMARWHAARDSAASLPAGEQAELDALVDAELRASGDRAASAAQQVEP